MAIIRSMTEIICPICNKLFLVAPYRLKKNVTTCSRTCANKYFVGERNHFAGRNHSCSTKEIISRKNKKGKIYKCTCGCDQDVYVPKWREIKSKQKTYFVNKNHRFSYEKGENSVFWRGGISKLGRGKGWDKIAQLVRNRDKVCMECGRTEQQDGKKLNVHHIIPWRISYDNSLSNLITLCNQCHLIQTKKEIKRYIKYYPMPYKISICVECGKNFKDVNSNIKLCSEQCRRKRASKASVVCTRKRRIKKKSFR